MAKAKTDIEFEGLDDTAKKPASEPVAPVEQSEYTRCFLVSHPAYGVARVKEDSEKLAVEEFIRRKCPGFPVDELRKNLIVRELPFVPADSEKGKPGGWVRDKKKVGHAYHA